MESIAFARVRPAGAVLFFTLEKCFKYAVFGTFGPDFILLRMQVQSGVCKRFQWIFDYPLITLFEYTSGIHWPVHTCTLLDMLVCTHWNTF